MINLRNGGKNYFRLFCRYITILYFLNDVEEGGQTAFPIADSATFKRQVCMFNLHVLKSRCTSGESGYHQSSPNAPSFEESYKETEHWVLGTGLWKTIAASSFITS